MYMVYNSGSKSLHFCLCAVLNYKAKCDSRIAEATIVPLSDPKKLEIGEYL